MNTSPRACTFVLFIGLPAIAAGNTPQKTFATAEEATNALLGAMRVDSYPQFVSVAGEKMSAFWNSGDAERDAAERDRYLEGARRSGFRIAPSPDGRKLVYVGEIEEAFPAPLMQTGKGWKFDGDAGSAEMLNRRIRRNENAALESCRRFREAELEYLSSEHDGERAFAQKILSTPSRQDGLFWQNGANADESPLGPPFAAAAFSEQQPGRQVQPLFGYYFKILFAQGPAAPGGALEYRVKGKLRKGFALIAWPAQYGVDGVKTFLINHFGDVYQKDLGAGTAFSAPSTTTFNPDASWIKLEGYELTEDASHAVLRPN